MAITQGTITSTSATTASTTFAHNNNGDYLVVAVASFITDAGGNPTGVTFNGVAMTLISAVTYASNVGVSLWGLIAPASGSFNVVVTYASGTNNPNVVGALSYSGVHQTTPTGTPVQYTSASSTVPTVTVVGATDDWIIDAVAIWQATPVAVTGTAGASQTERVNLGYTTARKLLVSTEPGAASVVMDWSLDQLCRVRQAGVALKVAAAASGRPPYEGLVRGLNRGLAA